MVCSGPQAEAALSDFFRPIAGRHPTANPKRPRFGLWAFSNNPSVVEEVVVVNDFGDQFELHHHGGVAIQALLREQLGRLGFRERTWGEWIVAGEPDPIRQAALVSLASVLTRRGAVLLLDQYHGALRCAIQRIRQMLQVGQLESARQEMLALSERSPFGLRTSVPWKVTFTGPPNVGKSSLLNAMLGFRRAIVTDEPGTTRDVVTELTALDGWPVRLADTAGVRSTPESRVEAIGMAQAEQEILQADVVVQVRECGGPEFAPLSSVRVPILRVTNKSDLLPTENRTDSVNDFAVSARTGDGIAALAVRIGKLLGTHPPQPGAAVPFLLEQVQSLHSAVSATEQRDAAIALQALAVFG
ncbi:MAG: 50S ribosome-binding GTPase [Planctomycetota bacterium]|nr:50S ribosome-binding GTPase [Planctomycetota bacterium]MDA1177611.1 50S ribosome-binding GTPase [Planctomycetota bacterium]